MNMRKALLYGLLASLITLGFWLGGYTYFIRSDDWRFAQKTISESEAVKSSVGQVREISVSPFWFSYRFSGQWGQARLRLLVRGDKGEAKFRADLEKSRGQWTLAQIEER